MATRRQTAIRGGYAARPANVRGGQPNVYGGFEMPEDDADATASSSEESEHEDPEQLLQRTTAADDICINPLRRSAVFHCKTCRHVLTDSTAVVATCGSLDSLIINGVTKLVVFGSKVRIDKPECEALELSCRGCNAFLGYRFFGLPPAYAQIEFCYSLLATKVTSHTLGEMEVGSGAFLGQSFGPPVSLSDNENPDEAMDDGRGGPVPTSSHQPAHDSAAQDAASQILQDRVAQLEEDLAGVRKMIMLHNEALARANILQH